MLLLGIDIGTSSIKVSVADAQSRQCIASAQYPETEAAILSPHPGWAEQSPDTWWEHVQQAILKLHAQKKYDPKDIAAIGIAYQMHGLVMTGKDGRSLRNSIIWCDSRAVETGEKLFHAIGPDKCLAHLLNSPGNFTASKLAWVKHNEPEIYEQADKIMLPGDYIAFRLTGTISTSISALSEGVFWDFKKGELSHDVLHHSGISRELIPAIQDVCSVHGTVSADIAAQLSLKTGIPVSYKAGDQPNNALSLNVLEPGDVAATAGTSGVIYGVSDALTYDPQSRVNSFAHVNHTPEQQRIGVLLCINGTGILYRWIRDIAGPGMNYPQLNAEAATIAPGSDGLIILPFGNGAERILNNNIVDAHIQHIDLNKHTRAHLYRAAQEGIVFAFRYGLDIMRENGMSPQVIRAGQANMFLSDVFASAFVDTLEVPVELYPGDGSLGAALGAGIGAGIFKTPAEAFSGIRLLQRIDPKKEPRYEEAYQKWLEQLKRQMTEL